MTQTTKLLTTLAVVALMVAAPAFGATARIDATSSQIVWNPDFAFDRADLRVHGPDGFMHHQVFEGGVLPSFSLARMATEAPAGSYTWSLTATSPISPELADSLKAARAAGDLAAAEQMKAQASFQGFTASGYFYYDGLQLIVPSAEDSASRFDEPQAELPAANLPTEDLPTKDQVINDDLIVTFSACIGMDCVNGENFGFDTLRLKENNLRIKAQDTSNSGSFPTTDWQITFNDSANGGANKFSIDDIDSGRTPFTIEATAPSNSLYVDDGGRIGFGTATPTVQLHVVDGNTPTLRLEQDGSSGFTPQTWDLAGNEANFFVRDATNGSRLPLQIKPGAPTASIFVKADGDVGIGTNSPSADLHVVNATSPAAQRNLLRLTNFGRPNILMEDTEVDNRWVLSPAGSNEFEISKAGTMRRELFVDEFGNTTITGTLTACSGGVLAGTTCTAADEFPDYVFEEDYDLMPLDELRAYVKENKHLPRVPKAKEAVANGIDMTTLQLRLLEKVEELTLYTLSQQETIDKQGELIEELRKQVAEQK